MWIERKITTGLADSMKPEKAKNLEYVIQTRSPQRGFDMGFYAMFLGSCKLSETTKDPVLKSIRPGRYHNVDF